MEHSSQSTKEEYEEKHEGHITTKMANMWERKIGSDKVHTSPKTVVDASKRDFEKDKNPYDVKLTHVEPSKPAAKEAKNPYDVKLAQAETGKPVAKDTKNPYNVKLAKVGSVNIDGGKNPYDVQLRKTKTDVDKNPYGVKLTKTGSDHGSNGLVRKSTADIIENFEKMKKAEDAEKDSAPTSNAGGTREVKNVSVEESKGEIYGLIAKLAARLSEADDTLKAIKARVDAM